jgi:rod shape-determining protein MreD
VGAGALGGHALVGTLVGYLAGRVGVRIYKRQISTQVIFTTLVAVLAHSLVVLVESGGSLAALALGFPLQVLLRAVYAGLLAPLFFLVGFSLLGRDRRLHAR